MKAHTCKGPGLLMLATATLAVAAPLFGAPAAVYVGAAVALLPAAGWVAAVEDRVITACGGH